MKVSKIIIFLMIINNWLNAIVIDIHHSQDFNTHILSKKQPAIIVFSSEWGTLCNRIKKPFEDLSNEPEFKHVIFAHIDIDKQNEISKAHNIIGVPTFVYLENGTKKDQSIGLQNIESLKTTLRTVLRTHHANNATAPVSLACNTEKQPVQKQALSVKAEHPTNNRAKKTAETTSSLAHAQSSWSKIKHGCNVTLEKARSYFNT